MIIICVILLSGILLGRIFRNHKKIIILSERLSDWSILLLLFFMGLTTATNQKVIDNIGGIGLLIVIITVGAVIGSLLAGLFIYIKFFKGGDEKQP